MTREEFMRVFRDNADGLLRTYERLPSGKRLELRDQLLTDLAVLAVTHIDKVKT